MSDDSNNVIEAGATRIGAEAGRCSMALGVQAVKSREAGTPPASVIAAAVAAVTLPLLKVGTAQAIAQCDTTDASHSVEDMHDPGDCHDCALMTNPTDCLPQDVSDALGDQFADNTADNIGGSGGDSIFDTGS